MSVSIVGICNSALVKIGAEPIVSLADNTKRARLCNEQYEKLRDEVLYSHPWNFALKRTTISPDVSTPDFGWDEQYSMPSDCLRVWRMEDNDIEYAVEGRKILSDETSLSFVYIYQVTDVSKFTPYFCETLALRLAQDLAFPIANSLPLAKGMSDAYEQKIKNARSYDAQEGTPESLEINEWLTARL